MNITSATTAFDMIYSSMRGLYGIRINTKIGTVPGYWISQMRPCTEHKFLELEKSSLCDQSVIPVSQSQFSARSQFSGLRLRLDESNTKRHPHTSMYAINE